MAPLLRRSWAPSGHTPLIHHRTRHFQKVSVIAALCVSPARNRVCCYFRLHPGRSITSLEVRGFLRQLLRQLDAPMVLIWDRLSAHRSRVVQSAFLQTTPQISPWFLPSYAPELNPVEYLWSYMKMNPLANCAIEELSVLASTTRLNVRRLQHKQDLLRSFIQHSPLSLRLY
jgi:transposase